MNDPRSKTPPGSPKPPPLPAVPPHLKRRPTPEGQRITLKGPFSEVFATAPLPAPAITPSRVRTEQVVVPVTLETPLAPIAIRALPAGFFRMAGALIIDASLAGLVGALALFALGARSAATLSGANLLTALGISVAFSVGYGFVFSSGLQGRTLGRLLFGLHLVDARGRPPQLSRALARAVLSLMSFGLVLSGFWLALVDRKGQTLHDKLTGTFVVRLRPRGT